MANILWGRFTSWSVVVVVGHGHHRGAPDPPSDTVRPASPALGVPHPTGHEEEDAPSAPVSRSFVTSLLLQAPQDMHTTSWLRSSRWYEENQVLMAVNPIPRPSEKRSVAWSKTGAKRKVQRNRR